MPPSPSESLRALDAEFELGESLGRGAMGSVYRARERASGREVALKILHADSSSAGSRFLREGQVTASLQHPGIVRIHSIGTLSGRPCLAYELVPEARTYEAAVKEQPELALPLLVQAGRALGAAHALGLTHRDVKSENLLVDGEGRLRVSDFGLVTGEELSRLTQSGAWVGTPQTMAPEQFGDRAATGPPSDVWALGVLLYWALAGRYPFEGAESMIELASAITAGDFRPPSKIRPTPRALEAVCLRALSTKAEERYPNGDAFADALDAAQAAPVGPARGGRGGVLALAALAVLVAAGAWISTGPTPPAPPSPTQSAGGSAPEVTAEPSPSSSSNPTPASTEDMIPEGIMGWKTSRGVPLDPKILDYPYARVESSFEHLLFALRNGYGPESELRAARALLSGTGVARDVTPALAILRHGATEDRRGAQVLLIETLAEEGRLDEELLWIGRLAQAQPRPFELHRLWKLARSRDPRAARARAIWRALNPSRIRTTALSWLRGGARRRLDAIRARPPEQSQFLIESMVAGWRRDPDLGSDWQLSVALDNMGAKDQRALIAFASPSRRLARLSLRRGERAHLEYAIAPTLPDADEAWLLELVEELLKLRAKPPCATAILAQLQRSPTLAARRWVAVCEAQGFVLPQARRGLETLKRLHDGGDHQAGVLLVRGAPAAAPVAELEKLLRAGVQARHPASLLAQARISLKGRPDPSQAQSGFEAMRAAADAGLLEAQLACSGWLRKRAKTKRELEAAYSYATKAAAQGSAWGLELQSIFLSTGVGCAKDPTAAKISLRRAARLGRAESSVRFGNLLCSSPGKEKYVRQQRLTIAHDHFKRALSQTGSFKARLGLALCRLQLPDTAQEGLKSLVALAREFPTSKAATELGRELLERGEPERAEPVLERAATRRTAALDLLLAHWRSSGRAERAATYLERALAAKQPAALIVAARERFASDPKWAKETLMEVGRPRPQALSVLGDLLWETGRERERRQAYQLWLHAESRGNESARAALTRHDPPR
jgi:serine/threonine protein kinase/TPR repeat protein